MSDRVHYWQKFSDSQSSGCRACPHVEHLALLRIHPLVGLLALTAVAVILRQEPAEAHESPCREQLGSTPHTDFGRLNNPDEVSLRRIRCQTSLISTKYCGLPRGVFEQMT
jgi:hypothetical protein